MPLYGSSRGVVCEVVRSPRPSNKPEKEKVNGQESEEGFEKGSEKIDGEVIVWGKEF